MCLPGRSSCLIPTTDDTTSRDDRLSAAEVSNLPILKGPVPTTRWDTTRVESFHAQSELPRSTASRPRCPGPQDHLQSSFSKPRLAALLARVSVPAREGRGPGWQALGLLLGGGRGPPSTQGKMLPGVDLPSPALAWCLPLPSEHGWQRRGRPTDRHGFCACWWGGLARDRHEIVSFLSPSLNTFVKGSY